MRFDWNRARAFLVTAEEGSLSAAARALGMTQPTLGRQVDGLEEELGVVLFERAGRGLVLTASGIELLDHVRRMGEAAGSMSLAASGQAQSIDGTISITASEIQAAYLLPPIVERLRRLQPGIQVDIVSADMAVDLRRREADIAVRSFRPTEPELIARKLRDDAARLYAATSYLDRIGRPATAEAVSRADFIGFDATDRYVDGLNRLGLSLTPSRVAARSASHMVHWQMVKAGVGIGIVPEVIGDREPLVERVLDDVVQPMVFPMWLTTHRELHTSRRVRLVFEFLVSELTAPGNGTGRPGNATGA